MCLILFAHKAHPIYKLIIAANRDEFYHRPTKPAGFWDDQPEVLAGRDMEAGGTWMGVNKNGSIAMLTNYRDLNNVRPHAPSRGALVSDFLMKSQDGKQYLESVSEKGAHYNGFNLIVGDADRLYYYGNYDNEVRVISPGVHGLSNALLNTSWPKVDNGKKALASLIKEDFTTEDLFALLKNDIKAPISELPDTGVGQDMEEMLSPLFIKSPNYGSRCSTVITVSNDNVMSFTERTYQPTDSSYADKHYQLNL